MNATIKHALKFVSLFSSSSYLQAIKQFIDLCNNIGSSCTPRRNISETTAVKFLYARKFDVPRAVSLYEQHEQIRLKEGLYNIDPDIEPLRSELQTGKFTILVCVFCFLFCYPIHNGLLL